MQKWEKPKEETVSLFYTIVPDDSLIEKRKMFGYPCCFYNNNMFMGVHNNTIVLRMKKQDRETFIHQYSARIFEPMPGRMMKEYCVIPEAVLVDMEVLHTWVEKSLHYAKSLPKKEKKK